MRKELVSVIVILAFLGIGGLYLLLKPNEQSPTQQATITPTPLFKTFNLVIKEQKLQGETELKMKKGETVEFTITSDRDDEFHLHGYDKELTLPKGRSVKLMFTADTAGSFPFELHEGGIEVGKLIVEP